MTDKEKLKAYDFTVKTLEELKEILTMLLWEGSLSEKGKGKLSAIHECLYFLDVEE